MGCFNGLRIFAIRRLSKGRLYPGMGATEAPKCRLELAPDFRRRLFDVFQVDSVLLQCAQDVIEQ